MKVFILHDVVYTSSTDVVLNTVPNDDPESKNVFEDSLITECSARRWLASINIFVAYIPLRVHWNTPLLQRFAYNRSTIPLDKIGTKYRLRASIVAQWLEFEQLLLYIHRVLTEGKSILVPMTTVWFKHPSEWGYTRTHRTESHARGCAMKSRQAFIHLMALTTFYIALNVGSDSDYPEWVDTLEKQGNLLPDLVHQIKNSVIGDLSEAVPRVGTIVNATTIDIVAHQVRTMLTACVPVWIAWGPINKWDRPLTYKDSPSQILQRHFPSNAQVEEAKRAAHAPPPDISGGAWTVHASGNDPAPSTSSRQSFASPPDPNRMDISDNTWSASASAWNDPASAWNDPASAWNDPASAWNDPASTWNDPASTWNDPASTWNDPTSISNDSASSWNAPATPWDMPIPQENPPSTPALPRPSPESRQRYGETWQAFFEREARRHARMESFETPEERQARLARQRDSENFPSPGRRGPRVFRWEEIDDFLMRVPVSRNEVDSIWEDYARSQMRYNAFDREWDLCREFDPDGVAPIDIDDDDDHQSELEEMYGSRSQMEDGELAEPTLAASERVLDIQPPEQWIQGIPRTLSISHSAESAPVFSESLLDIVSSRYGFDWDPSTVGGHIFEPIDAIWKKYGTIVLQDTTSPVNREYKGPISSFIKNLLEKDLMSLPRLHWDLFKMSWTPLRDRMDDYFAVNQNDLEGKIVYTLTPQPHVENRCDWVLTVHSATTVLQCIRSATSTSDAARYLLQRGVMFNTFLPRAILEARLPTRPCLTLPHHIGLGERREGYVPGAADYEAYENARDAFLRSPRGRAALLKGGIVWRLAMEFLEPGLVLAGPSDDALVCGQSFRPIAGNPDYYDDYLKPDELDLICGVYQVRTGILNLRILWFLVAYRKTSTGYGDQVSHLSWWPKHATWEKSQFNVGYWTRFAEEWFQRRLAEIRSNNAQCKTAAQWYRSIPKKGSAVTLIEKYEQVATAFLNGYNQE
jgi:hypothetical protein